MLDLPNRRRFIRMDGPLHVPQPGDLCVYSRQGRHLARRGDGQMLVAYGRANAAHMAGDAGDGPAGAGSAI